MTVQSSQRAILLIVTEEDGDKVYYLKTEEHFSWPGGASGPTIGVGYDCGYETADSIEADWKDFVDAAMLEQIKLAAGKRGETAHMFCVTYRDTVTIPWDVALKQFQAHELPKWEDITRAHLPNTHKLSGDSFGALVSLTYNRGPSYDSPGSRYVEMRNIKAHMAAEQFDLIPGEFLAMRRLWPKGEDLWNRRTHEAILFRDGLIVPSTTASVVA
jgi:GH24 family phage-related lysozyme (muramidase)